MNDLPNLSKFLLNPDEVYVSDTTYENTVGFLKFLASDHEESLPLTEDVLVVELKEGVFIKATNSQWCETLSALAEKPSENFPVIKNIPSKRLDDLARNYRQPLNSFGDYRLLRWKVGF